MVEAGCLYRAAAWLRLHNCKISASIGNLANSAKRCAAGEKLRPAGKAGRQPSGDRRHAVSQKRAIPFRRGPSAFADASSGRIPATIPKENAVFDSAQARFPTDIAQGTRRGQTRRTADKPAAENVLRRGSRLLPAGFGISASRRSGNLPQVSASGGNLAQ